MNNVYLFFLKPKVEENKQTSPVEEQLAFVKTEEQQTPSSDLWMFIFILYLCFVMWLVFTLILQILSHIEISMPIYRCCPLMQLLFLVEHMPPNSYNDNDYSLIIGNAKASFQLCSLEAVNKKNREPILWWLPKQDRHFTSFHSFLIIYPG